jgi:hypothetical protein
MWRAHGKLRIAMIAGDELNRPCRAKHERHPRVDGGGDDVESRCTPSVAIPAAVPRWGDQLAS